MTDDPDWEHALINPHAVAAGFMAFANVPDSAALARRVIDTNELLTSNGRDHGLALDAWGQIVMVPMSEVPGPLAK